MRDLIISHFCLIRVDYLQVCYVFFVMLCASKNAHLLDAIFVSSATIKTINRKSHLCHQHLHPKVWSLYQTCYQSL